MFKKMLVSVLLLFSLSMKGSELIVPRNALMAPSALGKVQLIKNSAGFSLTSSTGITKEIQSAFVDSALRSMDTKTLAKILAGGNCYLSLGQLSGGDYSIRLNGRLRAVGQ
jgi:hypothetical protein